MYFHKIDDVSIANGTGVRVVLWVSGCTLFCKGCHNPETWSFTSGQPFDDNAKKQLFNALNKPYIQGLTISGGHPLEKQNISEISNLLYEVKKTLPNKDIWLYTGYRINYNPVLNMFSYYKNGEDGICFNPFIDEIIKLCDIVVDGSYIEKLRNTTLPFRGSSNQRIIDIKESLNNKEIVVIEDKKNGN